MLSLDQRFNYFPQAWFPLCLSNEIKKGEIKEIEAFGTTLTYFRNDKNKIGVVSRFCPHMGTRLKLGKIEGEHLVCPFHKRQFNCSGKCVKAPGHDEAPSTAHLFSLPTHEEFGVVFVFLSSEAKYPFPRFSRATENQSSTPITMDLDVPYQSISANAFDTHHLECIHNRGVGDTGKIWQSNEFHLEASMIMKVIEGRFYDFLVKILNAHENDIKLDCWGGNSIIITNGGTKDNILITALPKNRHQSRFFVIAITQKSDSFWKTLVQSMRLYITARMGVEFLRPDIHILPGMQPEARKLSLKTDAIVAQFWRYWDQLPRDIELQDKLIKGY